MFIHAGGALRDLLKIFGQFSVLAAMFAEVGSLYKLYQLLCFSEPEDKLLSLSEGEMTGMTGLESRVVVRELYRW